MTIHGKSLEFPRSKFQFCWVKNGEGMISRLVMQRGLAFALLWIGPSLATEPTLPDKVSFYFAAHGDDWQLFMNPSAFEDVLGAASKTVFVHMTAGDDGLGMGRAGRKHPFYLARENGAETAIRFMADADGAPAEKSASQLSLRGHLIYRVSYRHTVSYFLRLPDGNPWGSGYFDTGYQSLKRLANRANDVLWAIDGSASYRGWNDLVATLRALLDYERGNAALIQINVAELDERINPNDHSDHLMTARAALEATSDLSCVRRVHYMDYASARLPENLDSQQRDRESSVFAVTLSGVLALDHAVAWHRYDRSFVGRNYFRVEEASGRCDPQGTSVITVKR
jgi:hypothetical protein